MTTVNIHQAKTQLSRLLKKVEAGHEVLIARAGKPVARLVPVVTKRPKFGAAKGEFELTDAVFEPLPEEELAAYEQ